jgi:hypothetical protein
MATNAIRIATMCAVVASINAHALFLPVRCQQPPSIRGRASWQSFLCNHADGIASVDLFVILGFVA